ncbi:MAG: hypothetical protein RLZZ479_904 [Bacteroidota bacterium]
MKLYIRKCYLVIALLFGSIVTLALSGLFADMGFSPIQEIKIFFFSLLIALLFSTKIISKK